MSVPSSVPTLIKLQTSKNDPVKSLKGLKGSAVPWSNRSGYTGGSDWSAGQVRQAGELCGRYIMVETRSLE